MSLLVLAEGSAITLEVRDKSRRIVIYFAKQPLIAGVRRVWRSGVVLRRLTFVVADNADDRHTMWGFPVTVSEYRSLQYTAQLHVGMRKRIAFAAVFGVTPSASAIREIGSPSCERSRAFAAICW